ncbi:hypothetical protein ACH4TV_43635 [Streptomyces sp. NPDC020898]|uniref:hypothetical protein n=1 Tax=Streptomyces sp. NPDC020898 TaxID=3365101 RepID=UPI0037A48EE4
MLAEALAALAAAGGGAIVQAAGSDAWEGLRRRTAQLLGREPQTQQAVLERLDHTRTALEQAAENTTDPQTTGTLEQAIARQEIVWQTRLEDFLESLDDTERQEATAQLQALLVWAAAQSAQNGTDTTAGTVIMNATVSGNGRSYQAGQSMTVHEK